jgi:hypothetical protein
MLNSIKKVIVIIDILFVTIFAFFDYPPKDIDPCRNHLSPRFSEDAADGRTEKQAGEGVRQQVWLAKSL